MSAMLPRFRVRYAARSTTPISCSTYATADGELSPQTGCQSQHWNSPPALVERVLTSVTPKRSSNSDKRAKASTMSVIDAVHGINCRHRCLWLATLAWSVVTATDNAGRLDYQRHFKARLHA